MSQSSSTSGESASDLWFERSLFAGLNLESVAYGIHICVFFTTIHYIVKTPSGIKRVGKTFTALVCLLFAMGTINAGCGIKFTEMMWIDDRNFPGGPPAWLLNNFGNVNNVVELSVYVIANLLADASLIYRAYLVWNGNLYIIILPTLAFLASTALSILAVIQSTQPNSNYWSQTIVQFALPYYALSMSVNVSISFIIAFRLWRMRRMVASSSLGAEHSKLYTSIVAMIIESAALFSVPSFLYIICYAVNSNIQNLIEPPLVQIICIAPELIILRVAQGRAWTRDTGRHLTMMSSFHAASADPQLEVSTLHGPANDMSAISSSGGASSGFALERFDLESKRAQTSNSSRTLGAGSLSESATDVEVGSVLA